MPLTMDKRQILVGVFMVAMAGSSAAQSSPTVKDFVGRYIVREAVGHGAKSGSVEEGEKLLGTALTISQNAIVFAGKSCTPDYGFKVGQAATASVLNRFYGGTTPLDFGLPKRAFLLNGGNCLSVFKMPGKGKVVFGWDNVIVRAAKETADDSWEH